MFLNVFSCEESENQVESDKLGTKLRYLNYVCTFFYLKVSQKTKLMLNKLYFRNQHKKISLGEILHDKSVLAIAILSF